MTSWTSLETVDQKSDFKFNMIEYAANKSAVMRNAIYYVEKKTAEFAGKDPVTIEIVDNALTEYRTRKVPDLKKEVMTNLDKILSITGRKTSNIDTVAAKVLKDTDETVKSATSAAIKKTKETREKLGSTNLEVFEKYLDNAIETFQKKLVSRTHEQYVKAGKPATDMGINMGVKYNPKDNCIFKS